MIIIRSRSHHDAICLRRHPTVDERCRLQTPEKHLAQSHSDTKFAKQQKGYTAQKHRDRHRSMYAISVRSEKTDPFLVNFGVWRLGERVLLSVNHIRLRARSMPATLLSRHPGLFATSRLQRVATLSASPSLSDWLILSVFGVLAACSSTFLDLGIQRVPGHAILRVVFPLAMGLAVVPRYGAGCMMGSTAGITAIGLYSAGFRGEALGMGALASLIATGPLLDGTLRRANGGWRQIASFMLAGLTSNLIALAVRGSAKAIGWEAAGRRPLAEWLTQAVATYILCGILAGLISGMVLFSTRKRRNLAGDISS